MTGKRDGDDTGPPFERHGTYYRILKLAVLAAAVVIALKVAGVW
jgi:hypothetical protein